MTFYFWMEDLDEINGKPPCKLRSGLRPRQAYLRWTGEDRATAAAVKAIVDMIFQKRIVS
jgi:hypothetical protein